jgi:hypothetical protein
MYDTDAADPAPISRDNLLRNSMTKTGSLWRPIELPIASTHLSDWKFVRVAPLKENLDIKTYDAGAVYFSFDSSVVVEAGDMLVTYEVELKEPQYLAPSEGSLDFSCIGTTVYPLSETPTVMKNSLPIEIDSTDFAFKFLRDMKDIFMSVTYDLSTSANFTMLGAELDSSGASGISSRNVIDPSGFLGTTIFRVASVLMGGYLLPKLKFGPRVDAAAPSSTYALTISITPFDPDLYGSSVPNPVVELPEPISVTGWCNTSTSPADPLGTVASCLGTGTDYLKISTDTILFLRDFQGLVFVGASGTGLSAFTLDTGTCTCSHQWTSIASTYCLRGAWVVAAANETLVVACSGTTVTSTSLQINEEVAYHGVTRSGIAALPDSVSLARI